MSESKHTPGNAAICAAASAIANARGMRRGVPTITNILDILPEKLVAEVTEDAAAALEAVGFADMLAALKQLVSDILEYERINNFAPNPGKRDCWQSVTRARAAIAKATGATP